MPNGYSTNSTNILKNINIENKLKYIRTTLYELAESNNETGDSFKIILSNLFIVYD